MAETVDRLEVEVEANARSANAQLDRLIGNLNNVNTALRSVNAGGLQGLANGVRQLSNSMQGMNSVGTADFTRLTRNIQKLTSIDTSNLNRSASAMNIVGKAINNLSGVSANAIQIGEVSKNIAKLGGKNIQNAISTIPQLAIALKNMMEVLSKAPSVSQNIIQMTNALASLASQGGKVGTASKSVQNSLSNYSVATTRSIKSTRSLTNSITGLVARLWVLQKAVKSIWSAANSSMDFLETVNYYDVAMRQIGQDNASQWKENGASSAEAYADSFSTRMSQLNEKMTGFSVDENGNTKSTGGKSLGIDANKVMNTEAVFAQMSNSLGVTGETAMNTSKALTMLGADWASLRNLSFDTSWNKFASALSGQSRAVRSLGIDITNATLQEYAYRYGIKESITDMNQATKTQLRLLAILDQSKVAYGDLANTMQSPANQLRMLQNNFTVLGRTIGNLFVPIIQKVLPYINGLVIALQRLFQWVGGLMGVDFSSINSSIGGADNDMGDLVDDTDDESDALDTATKKAKKLKNVLGSYDELNILKYNSDDDDSNAIKNNASGGNPMLDKAISDAMAEYQKAWDDAFARMNNKAQEIADKICNAFKRGDYEGIGKYISNGITKALNDIPWKSIYSVAEKFGTGFAEFLNGLITPDLFGAVGKTIANALNTAIYTALAFGKTLDWDQIGKSIGTGINSFFKNFDFKALADAINVWVQGLAKMLRQAIKTINWMDILKGIFDFVGELDVDTIAIVIGAFTLKYLGKVLTGKVLKDAIMGLFSTAVKNGLAASGMSAGAAAAEGAVAAFELAAIIYVSFKLSEDAKAWMNNIKQYGWDEGRKKTASENTANPYNNGNAVSDSDIESMTKGFQDLRSNVAGAWEESNAWAANNRENIAEWFSDINQRSDEWASSNREKLAAVGTDIGTWFNDSVAPWFTTDKWSALFSNIGTSLSNSWSNVVAWWESSTLVTWWTNDVSPWFTAEKWTALFSSIGTSLTNTWNGVVTWWESSALVTWWDNDVAPWFTSDKWNQLFSTIKNGLSNTWKDVSQWWKSSALSKWWSDDVVPYFTTDKWSFNGIKNGLSKAFKDAVTAIKNIWNDFASWLNNKLTFTIPSKTIAGFKIGGGSFSLGKLPTFSTGGFPEDGLFMANHGEMVGQFGNGKNVVANNSQIVEGIKAGVADAMMEVYMATNSGSNSSKSQSKDIVLNVDGKELARTTIDNIDDLARCGQITLGFA